MCVCVSSSESVCSYCSISVFCVTSFSTHTYLLDIVDALEIEHIRRWTWIRWFLIGTKQYEKHLTSLTRPYQRWRTPPFHDAYFLLAIFRRFRFRPTKSNRKKRVVQWPFYKSIGGAHCVQTVHLSVPVSAASWNKIESTAVNKNSIKAIKIIDQIKYT